MREIPFSPSTCIPRYTLSSVLLALALLFALSLALPAWGQAQEPNVGKPIGFENSWINRSTQKICMLTCNAFLPARIGLKSTAAEAIHSVGKQTLDVGGGGAGFARSPAWITNRSGDPQKRTRQVGDATPCELSLPGAIKRTAPRLKLTAWTPSLRPRR
jgi:hypothetical protein